MSLEFLEKLQMDLDTRTIYLVDDVDKNMKHRLAVCLSFLDRFDGEINIYINSGGGCLISTLAIFDLIRASNNVINGYVVGEACSGASIILQACDNRYITKHSSIMIHYGTHGLPSDIPKNNENLLGYYHSLQDDMVSIYKSRMRNNGRVLSDKKLAELLAHDSWFRAKDSVKFGLVDKIKNPSFEVYEYEEDMPEVSTEDLDAFMKQMGIE